MKSFIDDGYIYIWKDSETSYAVSKTGEGIEGYKICPVELDPYGAYSYEEAETYWNDNPDKRYEYVEPQPSQAELLKREADELKHYLADTDYAVIKCYDRGLNFAEEYPELYTARQQARDRINELENGGQND